MNVNPQLQILRKTEVVKLAGLSLSRIYYRTKDGEFPPPISLGARAVGFLKHEVEAVVSAYAIGTPPAELKSLVHSLVEKRQQIASSFGGLVEDGKDG